MKATLVYNAKEEPRVLIELETDEEREVMHAEPDLVLVRTGEVSNRLADLAYALQIRDDD